MPRTHQKDAASRLSAEREQTLVSTAREIFIEKGLGATTIDEIARRARMSKTTIYRRYRNKEALLEAVINEETTVIAASLQNYELDTQAPAQSLRKAADAIYEVATTRRNIEVRRLLVAQARRYPELSQNARKKLAEAAAGRLVPFLEALMQKGLMYEMNASRAASTFALVVSGGMRPLFIEKLDPEGEQLQMKLDMEVFLTGWGVRESEIE